MAGVDSVAGPVERRTEDSPRVIWHVAGPLPKPKHGRPGPWTRPRIQAEIRRIVGEQVGAFSPQFFVDGAISAQMQMS